TVLVMTPRGFEVQLLDEGKLVGIADDRSIDLHEAGPNVANDRVVHDRHQQGRSLRAVQGTEVEVAGHVGEANSGLHLTGRNVEQGTVELGALFVDPELLVELAATRDVRLGQRRVTMNGAGIAEEVEV